MLTALLGLPCLITHFPRKRGQRIRFADTSNDMTHREKMKGMAASDAKGAAERLKFI
jgi:hypothetical protein